MKDAFTDNDNHAMLSMPTKAMGKCGGQDRNQEALTEGLMDMQGWRQARPERMKVQQT